MMFMQCSIGDETLREELRNKLEKVVNRRYVVEAVISLKLLIKYFPVEKGEDDIRMVLDATANELNDAVWVPSSGYRRLSPGSDLWTKPLDDGL
mmetsp:Transcript_22371/g.34534  ORF Transcript_22371/g.34534 Transcript_22371/m.34534 type:complete len:94 (+) Transcript_22371:1253-1534(+)